MVSFPHSLLRATPGFTKVQQRSFTSNICELRGSKSRNQGSKTALRKKKRSEENWRQKHVRKSDSSPICPAESFEFTNSPSPSLQKVWEGGLDWWCFHWWWGFLEILWLKMSFSEKSVLFSSFKTITNIYDLLVATQTSCTKSRIFENSELYLNKGTSGSY